MAAITYKLPNSSNLQKLSKAIMEYSNNKLSNKVLTNLAANDGSYTDSDHVLAASTILNVIGKLSEYNSGTLTGNENTVLGKLRALQIALADTNTRISGLTHLTYEEVTGDIETQVPMASAKDDVIYLQHDEPSYTVGNDGYLLVAGTTNYATAGGYYAYYNMDQDKFYKATAIGTVTSTQLSESDAIFTNAGKAADNTYNLYFAVLTKSGNVTTAVRWICVGDTSIELSNYWSKKESDIIALRNIMIGDMTSSEIEAVVNQAFNAVTTS